MALITLPSYFPFSKVSLTLQRRTNALRSKYTGKRQVIVYPFAVWVLEGSIAQTHGNELRAREIRAFLADLEGQSNTFQMPVPGYTKPSTGLTTNANVSGITNARAKSIVFRNLPVGISVINKGDYFTVEGELKIVKNNPAVTNGVGETTVEFQPPLRKQVAHNAAIILQNPYCIMSAQEDDVANWDLSPPIRQQTKFEAIEAF